MFYVFSLLISDEIGILSKGEKASLIGGIDEQGGEFRIYLLISCKRRRPNAAGV